VQTYKCIANCDLLGSGVREAVKRHWQDCSAPHCCRGIAEKATFNFPTTVWNSLTVSSRARTLLHTVTSPEPEVEGPCVHTTSRQSFQLGFILAINQSFFSRRQFFSCLSRAIAY